MLAGAAPFNVYLDDGDNNPANDLVVAIGRNRTLTVAAVPEPASLVLFGVAAAGSVVASRVRRKRLCWRSGEPSAPVAGIAPT